MELVSIDEIVLSDVQIVSAGRTLRGDVAVVPQGKGFLIRKVALAADDTTITATGTVTDLSGPIGELNVKATTLNFDRLMAFAQRFLRRGRPRLHAGATAWIGAEADR